jgi:hypothetical protein
LEAGDKRFGLRLAYNYSYANVPGWNDGGSGAEVGVHGLFTVGHEISIHTGVNGILRLPINSRYAEMTEIAVSVPVVVHYNPFMLLPNRTFWEERFFVELGLQVDVPVLSTHGYYEFSDKFEDRRPFDIGAVIGFVSYLGGGVALDLRYCLSFTHILKSNRSSYLNQGSLGLRFFFN